MTEQPKDNQPGRPPAEQEEPREQALAEEVSRELAKLRAEQEDLMARLQRVSADYLNYQKRVQRDIAEAREYANGNLIKDLLVVLDDLERGLALARQERSEDDPLRSGVELAHAKALEILGRYGLTPIDAVGKTFDPDLHLALTQEVSEEAPPHTVLRELQRGYRLKGRTLRPSSVVVSQAMPKPGHDDESNKS
jgi:molecular chaperone GrpE